MYLLKYIPRITDLYRLMLSKFFIALLFGLVVSNYGFLSAQAAESDLIGSTPAAAVPTTQAEDLATTTPTVQTTDSVTAMPAAQSKDPASAAPTAVATDIASAANTSSSKDRILWGYPHRVGAFTLGLVVRTPVTIAKKSKEATFGDTIELVGDHRNPVLLGVAGTVSLPFGVTSGLFEGVCDSVGTSWTHSGN
jgi:hypothetical protein